jgi:hypothetical protein
MWLKHTNSSVFLNGFEKPKAGGAFFIFLSNWQKTKIEELPPLAYNNIYKV